jgi:DNA (cytosine-5)-methyltransferase 1
VAVLDAVSLFSNCGAGDLGFRRAGFRFRVMAEIDPRRLAVAAANHPGAKCVPGDLVKTWRRVVKEYRTARPGRRPDLLAACPPCQGMSSARSCRGPGTDPDAGSKDGRNLLVLPIARVARALKPRVIVVENVPEFLTRKVRHPKNRRAISAARLLTEELARDYEVFALSADLAEYGVPQSRRRAFLTFVRKGDPILKLLKRSQRAPFPRPTHASQNPTRKPITVGNALRRMQLPPLNAVTERRAMSSHRKLHRVPFWPDRRYQMVAAIPPRSGRSAWDNEACARCGTVDVTPADAVCPECRGPLLRPVVKRRGVYRLVNGFRASSYRRMQATEPAATITTASGNLGSDLTVHPWQNRLLSPLECALLQTFPRSFRWADSHEKWGYGLVRKMIGEAVPPRFTAQHGRMLASLLRGRTDVALVSTVDPRCRRPEQILHGRLHDVRVKGSDSSHAIRSTLSARKPRRTRGAKGHAKRNLLAFG